MVLGLIIIWSTTSVGMKKSSSVLKREAHIDISEKTKDKKNLFHT
jgi:hypothetical protein